MDVVGRGWGWQGVSRKVSSVLGWTLQGMDDHAPQEHPEDGLQFQTLAGICVI
jgi:hypothetical protein